METEIWKTITNFPNYEISNLGNIRNSNNKYIMKPFTNEAGYLRISLYNDTIKRKKFYIQRLVAQEFIENIENKPTVNHINNNTLDNRSCNLEWSTMKEQNIHKYKTNNKFEKKSNIKSIWRLNCDTLEKIEKYESTTQAVKWIKENNLTKTDYELTLRQSLINVSEGKNKTAYGFKWSYEYISNQNIMDNEIWKEIPFEIIKINNYFISDYGRIRNNRGEILNLSPNIHGYVKLNINKNILSVHRLVALVFLPNLNNKEFVNHIDGIKSNNKLDNLEWATCLENNLHKIKNGLSNTTKKVIQYDINMNKLNEFYSIVDASNQLNLHVSTISNCCSEKTKCTRRDKYIFRFG
jgi:hypothetical protein